MRPSESYGCITRLHDWCKHLEDKKINLSITRDIRALMELCMTYEAKILSLLELNRINSKLLDFDYDKELKKGITS